jgi:hypothetical protein
MQFMPGEILVMESNPKGLTLTTHRVRSHHEGGGQGDVVSIMLEEIASCAITRRSSPLFLIIAGIVAIGTLFVASSTRNPGEILLVGGGLTLVSVFLYFVTRRQTIEIASAGATIRQSVASMKIEQVLEFVNCIEEAKNIRYLKS